MVWELAACKQATGLCTFSMSRRGGGGGAGKASIRNDHMAAGASIGWTATGVGILGRLPDPCTGRCLCPFQGLGTSMLWELLPVPFSGVDFSMVWELLPVPFSGGGWLQARKA